MQGAAIGNVNTNQKVFKAMNDQDRSHYWTQNNDGHYNEFLVSKFREIYNEYPTIEDRKNYYLTSKNKQNERNNPSTKHRQRSAIASY